MEWLKWIFAALFSALFVVYAGYLLYKHRSKDGEEMTRWQRVNIYVAWGIFPLALGILLLPLDRWHFGSLLFLALTGATGAFGSYLCSVASKDKNGIDTDKLTKKEYWKRRKYVLAAGVTVLIAMFCMLCMLFMTFMPGGLPFRWWVTLAVLMACSALMGVAHFRGWKGKWLRWLVAPLLIVFMLFCSGWTFAGVIAQADAATTSVTEQPPPPDVHEETKDDVACAPDNPYRQFGIDNMAEETPPQVVLAGDVNVLAYAAYTEGLRADTSTEDLLTADGKCLNTEGIRVYNDLIAKVDVIKDLEALVDAYRDQHN